MRKLSLLVLVLMTSILFGQSLEKQELVIKDKVWVSYPFGKGGFSADVIINKSGVSKIIVKVDGTSPTKLQLYIRTVCDDSDSITISSTEKVDGKFIFNITESQNVMLKNSPIRKIGIKDKESKTAVFGTLFNQWVFTDYIPYQIKTKL